MTEPNPADGRVPMNKDHIDPSPWGPAPDSHAPSASYPPPTSYPQAHPAPQGDLGPGAMQPLVTIGDVTCTERDVITPVGVIPIRDARWMVSDMSATTERMSQAGIVIAIVGFFVVCFLSLLFLLMKERSTTGYIQVTVMGPNGFVHVTNIPATSQATMIDISNRVGYARMLSAR